MCMCSSRSIYYPTLAPGAIPVYITEIIDRYWHRVLGIGRYRRYWFGIGIGNNASIPAPHTRHVCVTKTIVLCFDDAHQSTVVCIQAGTGRGGRGSIDRLQSSSLSICACVLAVFYIKAEPPGGAKVARDSSKVQFFNFLLSVKSNLHICRILAGV